MDDALIPPLSHRHNSPHQVPGPLLPVGELPAVVCTSTGCDVPVQQMSSSRRLTSASGSWQVHEEVLPASPSKDETVARWLTQTTFG